MEILDQIIKKHIMDTWFSIIIFIYDPDLELSYLLLLCPRAFRIFQLPNITFKNILCHWLQMYHNRYVEPLINSLNMPFFILVLIHIPILQWFPYIKATLGTTQIKIYLLNSVQIMPITDTQKQNIVKFAASCLFQGVTWNFCPWNVALVEFLSGCCAGFTFPFLVINRISRKIWQSISVYLGISIIGIILYPNHWWHNFWLFLIHHSNLDLLDLSVCVGFCVLCCQILTY